MQNLYLIRYCNVTLLIHDQFPQIQFKFAKQLKNGYPYYRAYEKIKTQDEIHYLDYKSNSNSYIAL